MNLVFSFFTASVALAVISSPQEAAVLPAVVEGNSQFAFDLYGRLAVKPGNKFFSPYSISSALAMTSAGARGQTAQEMAATLHLPVRRDQVSAGFGDLLRKLQDTGKKRSFQLQVANALWGQKGIPFAAEFLRTTQTDYQADLRLVDFANDPESARAAINRWVQDKTNDKIKNLLARGIIRTKTRLVLVNAIYFKADWLKMFTKEATRPTEFRSPGLGTFKVPMMNQTKQLQYGADEKLQVIQIPYQDNEVSMVVILPRKDDGLGAVEKDLLAKGLQQLLARTKPATVRLSLPKFKMTEEFQLADVLQSMGMKLAFSDAADFSGLQSDSALRLKIDRVVHKAFVEVDEKGTEAAAATAVIVDFNSELQPPQKVETFKADHPFVFLIRHNATGSILFIGRVVDPRGA